MQVEKYYSSERQEMLKYLPKEMNACLEVGCGAGNFSKSIKTQHPKCEVWGVEIFEEAAKEASTKIDKTIHSSAEDAIAQLPDQHFDCIVFNDILEHLVDPYLYLENIKSKLKPNARIVASIPNMRHFEVLYELLFQKEFRYRENGGVLDKTHLRFFTIKSMKRLFEESGYTVTSLDALRPCRKVKIRILSWLTLGWLEDIRSPQYAITAENT